MANTDNLFLILKSEWFWMIDSDIKKEEYREITEYWYNRLQDRNFKTVIFQLGYSKTNRMQFQLKEITQGIGRSEWGATGSKTYIIKLGRRIL